MALLDWIVLLIIDNQLTTAMVIKTFFHGYYDPSEKKEKKKKKKNLQTSLHLKLGTSTKNPWKWKNKQTDQQRYK